MIAISEQRRFAQRQAEEAKDLAHQLQVELRWVSGDVMEFLNRFANAADGMPNTVKIDDIDVSDLLERLTWCRQRAATGEQLARVGSLRSSLMRTVRHIRDRSESGFLLFDSSDLEVLSEARRAARKAWSGIQGVDGIDD
ncbi:hypothetical protein X636_20540 [Pandoraea pnomenusa]|nr:hypothetical protein X636_20540 [Pandoraea pnomenusa]